MIHHSKQAKKAIVTFAIGKHYYKRWHKLCEANWRRYAEHHGYDLICIDSPLDKSLRAQSRSAAWQKCLILSDERVKKYDRVVWVDSDILINPNAPCIVSKVPEDKVGAVEMFTGPLGESLPGKDQFLIDRSIDLYNWSFRTGRDFYRNVGLPSTFAKVAQTGVMVLQPSRHRSILEHTYYTYQQVDQGHYEMESLSYELVKTDCVYWLDYRFNRLWIECVLRDYPFLLPKPKLENKIVRGWKHMLRGDFRLPPKKITTACLNSAFLNSYFLHFAGQTQYMVWLNTNVSHWSQLIGTI